MRLKLVAAILIPALLIPIVGCGGGGGGLCPADGLVAVQIVGPPMFAILDTKTPTLEWQYPDYPDDNVPLCHPEKYRITLRSEPFFDDPVVYFTDTYETEFTVPTPLELGTEYSWDVEAMVGSTAGPTDYSHLFTIGPICAADEMVAPIPLAPEDGITINNDWPIWTWDYPLDCTPSGYRMYLSTDSSFTDESLFGWQWYADPRWGPGHPLDDCQTYFWKVAPIKGTDTDYVLGPESAVFHFRIDVHGTCPSFTGDLPEEKVWPEFHIEENAACRVGPLLDYPITEYLPVGAVFPAEGRNENGSWIMLRLDADRRCWVAFRLGSLSDDVMKLPIGVAPALDIPGLLPQGTITAAPCSAYLQQTFCEANGCKWVNFTGAAPYCTKK